MLQIRRILSILTCLLEHRNKHLNRLPRFQDSHYIRDLPKPISYASGHRRSYPKRLVDADEIVIEEVKRHRVSVVFHLR